MPEKKYVFSKFLYYEDMKASGYVITPSNKAWAERNDGKEVTFDPYHRGERPQVGEMYVGTDRMDAALMAWCDEVTK